MIARKKTTQIKRTLSQINELVRKLCKEKLLLKGTYTYVMKKCANPKCSCHQKPKHPIHRITWIEKGKGYTLSLQNLNLKAALKYNKNYLEFRKTRLEMASLQKLLNKLLAQQEHALIDNKRIIQKLKSEGKKSGKA